MGLNRKVGGNDTVITVNQNSMIPTASYRPTGGQITVETKEREREVGSHHLSVTDDLAIHRRVEGLVSQLTNRSR